MARKVHKYCIQYGNDTWFVKLELGASTWSGPESAAVFTRKAADKMKAKVQALLPSAALFVLPEPLCEHCNIRRRMQQRSHCAVCRPMVIDTLLAQLRKLLFEGFGA